MKSNYLLLVQVNLHDSIQLELAKNIDELLGMHGLTMAKTYLQVYPDANVLIVDKAESTGGSWAKERLYPGLKTNNVFGSYEFGDFAMIPERYGAKPGGHIPGSVVHAYFCEAAIHFKLNLKIRYQMNVNSARLLGSGTWEIQMASIKPDGQSEIVFAKKLVVATGLTSEPYVPDISGSHDFRGMIIHSKQLKDRAADLAASRNVIVLGGNKSSWDVCYTAATSGATVHMIIRPSGGGPSYLWPRSCSYGPFNFSLASLSSSRIFTLFDPTPYISTGFLSSVGSWLHRTAIGWKICDFFWKMLDSQVKGLNGFDIHPELKKLEPWTTPFWLGNSLSIHNYETPWFDLVREGKISVHIAELEGLCRNSATLSTGKSIPADALVCCTGWKADPTLQIYVQDSLTNAVHPKPSILVALDTARAETEIFRGRPYLRNLPRRTSNAPSLSTQNPNHQSMPHQLYRLVVPWQPSLLEKKSLAFIGAHLSPHAVVVAQAQALWITAYLNDHVDSLKSVNVNHDAVRYEAILNSTYNLIRRPKETGGAGEKYPDLVFDSIPYVDTLLRDLGVKARRKPTWWKEMFEMYKPIDYKNIVQEWVEQNRNLVQDQ
jgi:hypothetical protein